MDGETFGQQLRKARKQVGFLTIAAFADALSERGLVYSDDAIGHWENDRRRPYHSDGDRADVLRLFQLLAERGGIQQIADVDALLGALNRPPLNAAEQVTYFPELRVAAESISNLPGQPPYSRLIGRDDVLASLQQSLLEVQGRSLVALSGLGGIGKTAIAYETVRSLMASGHFEGVAWETAKAEEFSGTNIRQRREQMVSLPAILASFARQIGMENLSTLPAPALFARLREALRSGRYLLVLDNLETLEAAQDSARQLYELVSPGRSRVLLTSRERLVEEAYIYDIFIRGLSEPAALELLRDEARIRGAMALLETDAALLGRIYRSTGGMPLALKLVVSQSLLGIALDEELTRLEGVVDEQDIYRFIYFTLWQKLSKPAQKLLIGAAAFATTALREMLQPVTELDDTAFNRAVPELVRASLLEVSAHPLAAQKRYDIHAMTRWFVNAPLVEAWNRQKGR